MNTPLPQSSLLDRARRITRAIPQAVACRRTAAHVWGLHVLSLNTAEDDWPVELIAPGHLAVPGCVTHVTSLPAADVTEHDGIRLTTRERTALDCARRLPRLEAVAALDQFLRRGVDLEALWHQCPSWHIRDLLSLADAGAGSPRESWLRVILVDGGIPRPATQIRVPLADGHHAYLDLGWPDFQVAVEYDGQQHHTAEADQLRDERRRTELRGLGWRIIVVRRDVFPGQTAELLHNVADLLIQQGWQPGTKQTIRILSRIRAARRRRRLPPRGAVGTQPQASDRQHTQPEERPLRDPSRRHGCARPRGPFPRWETASPQRIAPP
ncbi:endonuclease domain-containing protein [Nonomuraea rhizosphaerae]|uniref:endonuclease domain-containing protein n=1 Tax=Nonomuraea rhizosphaerae TaxID=2665663 RepID=UPI001C5F49B2|nr:endonuclease domain-containing protein [Nonomuraea rhizosphaerae]